MQYKIIATDLDKTLLGEDHRISRENWQAIETLHAMGVHIVPASGRAYEEMPTELLESPLIRYFITSDGTAVQDKKTGKTYDMPMSQGLGHWVLDTIYQYPINLMVHADTRSYVELATHNEADYREYHMSPYWIEFALDKECPVENLREFAYSLPKIHSLVPFFKNMEDLNICKDLFQKDPRLILAQTDPYNLEIFDITAGKGNALLLLAKLLGVDPAATIAVGDSTNDATMVQAAGLGLAMENGVPELKAIADQVICDYREHSAKYILEHYFQ